MKPSPLLSTAIHPAAAFFAATCCLYVTSISRAEEQPQNKDEVYRFGFTETACSGAGVLAPPRQEPNPEFATSLYQQLKGNDGNIFYSPYGITQAMGMASIGAKGDTAAEFVKALSLGNHAETFVLEALHLRNTLHSVSNQGQDKLHIANALCVTGIMPKQPYLDMVQSCFDAKVFNGQLEEINGWVKQKTDGHMESILDQLSPYTGCVLLNAVYFKGTWKNPFRPHNTEERDFHVSLRQAVKVSTMSRKGLYSVVRNEQYIAVELPYKTSCSMVLVMPAKADDFDKLEANLNPSLVNQICTGIKDAEMTEIELMLPKFRIKTRHDLVPSFKALGMAKAFNPDQADFLGMYDRDDMYIAQIVHKTALEVDELGSVAVAVTGNEIVATSASEPVPVVHFDRPFIVMIREHTTNTTLFMGRISDPTVR